VKEKKEEGMEYEALKECASQSDLRLGTLDEIRRIGDERRNWGRGARKGANRFRRGEGLD